MDWAKLMSHENRSKRGMFSQALIMAIGHECLTRKQRDPLKRDLMRQLGLPERYPEVRYPSPGNTPDDLEDDI